MDGAPVPLIDRLQLVENMVEVEPKLDPCSVKVAHLGEFRLILKKLGEGDGKADMITPAQEPAAVFRIDDVWWRSGASGDHAAAGSHRLEQDHAKWLGMRRKAEQ
jgi:hypothetical protein